VELVKEGVTGKLFPSGAPEVLAETLLEYYKKPEMVSSQGTTAREMIETRFTMAAMTKGYVEVYDKVLGQSVKREAAGHSNATAATNHAMSFPRRREPRESSDNVD
jgi:hypothetical protein